MRPYLYLGDAIEFIDLCLNTSPWYQETYNVLSGNHTPKEIIHYIQLAVGEKVKVDFIDSPIMNQLSYEVSSKKAYEFGFIPKGNPYQGIKETLEEL
jgi:UDP-glucose 4-epimerase